MVAVILSLAATGLGQIYCGRIVRGLMMFLGSLLFAPVIVVAALLPPATGVLVGLIFALLAVLGVYVYAVVDGMPVSLYRSWNSAPRSRTNDVFVRFRSTVPLVFTWLTS